MCLSMYMKFTSYRQKIINTWLEFCSQLKIPHSGDFSFNRVLGKDVNIQMWHICGLPRDSFSADNAVMLDSSSRFVHIYFYNCSYCILFV